MCMGWSHGEKVGYSIFPTLKCTLNHQHNLMGCTKYFLVVVSPAPSVPTPTWTSMKYSVHVQFHSLIPFASF